MEPIRRYSRGAVFPRRKISIYAKLNRQRGIERPHDHDFIEFVVVRRGSALHETMAGTRPIGPGCVLVLRPEAWHAYRKCRDFEIYNCCFGPELLRDELSWLINNETLGPLLWGRCSTHRNVATFRVQPKALVRSLKLLRELIRALAAKPAISRHEAAARLAVFLTSLPLHSRVETKPEPSPRSPHPLVLTCVQQLEERLTRDWRLADLARENGVSREHLVRLFKQKIGLPPMAYLDRCRAERAADLLKRTPLSIGLIGQKIGWESPVTFSRRFKFHFGICASNYRNRAQTVGESSSKLY